MRIEAWWGLALGGFLWVQAATGCGASIKPALKKQVDQDVAAISTRSEVYGAPTTEHVPELQPGTWARYKMEDADGHPSLLTYKVLEENGGAYWIETVTESYYGRQVQLMHASFGARMSPEDIELDRIFLKLDDKEVTEIPPEVLKFTGGTYKPILARLSQSWTGLPQEDVQVPAGTFQQAYRAHVVTKIMGFSDTSEVWYHDAAAVGGTVRSHSLDHGTTMELVEMGTDPVAEIPLP